MRKIIIDIGRRFAVHMCNEDILIEDLKKHAFNVTQKEAAFLEECIKRLELKR